MGIYQYWLAILLFSWMTIFMSQGSVLPVIGIANGTMRLVSLSGTELLDGTSYQYAPAKQALPSRNAPRLNTPRGGAVFSERTSTGMDASRGSMWFTLGYAADLVITAVLIPVLLRCYQRTVHLSGGGGQESNLLYRFIHTR
ncbi:hypothetical protein [Photobacterium nomapromontoriensis]|uniref:hypothetical protein n=1 Tax=Photobacterium nomapromontoriensis TaxID=2910237 RepID=UPI003D0C878B